MIIILNYILNDIMPPYYPVCGVFTGNTLTIYPTSFKMQAGGKGKQTGSIHQYVTRLVERCQRTCSLNE